MLTVEGYDSVPPISQQAVYSHADDLLKELEVLIKQQNELLQKMNASGPAADKTVSDYLLSTIARESDVGDAVTQLNLVLERQQKIQQFNKELFDSMFNTRKITLLNTRNISTRILSPFGIALVSAVGVIALIVFVNMMAICRTEKGGFSRLKYVILHLVFQYINGVHQQKLY